MRGLADERPSLRGAVPKSARDTVAHLHPLHECEHVGPLVWGERLLVLAQNVSHLFECEPEFVRVDELGDQRDVLARKPIIQADEEAVQLPGDLFVGGEIHGGIVSQETHSRAAIRAGMPLSGRTNTVARTARGATLRKVPYEPLASLWTTLAT